MPHNFKIKFHYPKFWQERKFLSYLLLPFSLLFAAATILRRIFADPIKFKSKVICVGNASAGGAGKTQVVSWLAKHLQQQKISFVIVTKGYNSHLKEAQIVTEESTASEVGDESVLLSRLGTVIAAKKVEYAQPLIAQLKPQVIIFDDGMQNPNFHKDFVILCIDGIRGFGNGFLIPAGPLRQNRKSALQQADAIIVVEGAYQSLPSNKPVFYANISLDCELNQDALYLAFSGIGNNQRFFNTLLKYGVNLKRTATFPDHHNYSESDCHNLLQTAQEQGLRLVTTAKDYVKIPESYRNYIACADVSLVVQNDVKLKTLLYEKLFQKN